MKNVFKVFVLIVFSQTFFAQNFDSSLISKKTELNFFETKKRGIESNKIIYFVEKDLQNVSAYKNGKKIWRTNVISACRKPNVGKSEIRVIKLKADKLIITYGKHNFAKVDIISGRAKFWGAD